MRYRITVSGPTGMRARVENELRAIGAEVKAPAPGSTRRTHSGGLSDHDDGTEDPTVAWLKVEADELDPVVAAVNHHKWRLRAHHSTADAREVLPPGGGVVLVDVDLVDLAKRVKALEERGITP